MCLAWVLVSFFSINLEAKLLIHPHKILKSYWGDQSLISSKSLLLSEQDKTNIKNKFNIVITESIFKTFLVKNKKDQVLGYGLLFTDKVKTKNMTLLLLLNASGNLESIEVVAFAEPSEYKPSRKWLDTHYKNKKLPEFILSKKTANISGATLSAHSVFKSAKVITAVWHYMKTKK